jgi:hypothetical protein
MEFVRIWIYGSEGGIVTDLVPGSEGGFRGGVDSGKADGAAKVCAFAGSGDEEAVWIGYKSSGGTAIAADEGRGHDFSRGTLALSQARSLGQGQVL